MMDDAAVYEAWRAQRAEIGPPSGFSDRVMQALGEAPSGRGVHSERRRWPRGIRTGLMAAAVAVALFRAVELLSVFSATGIEN